jgi:heparan-alpha-glucosaminide N-acetyltransferase
LVMLAAGFALRPCWGISKIRATPSWVLICMGISACCWLLLIYVMDLRGHQNWMKWLKPAGTSTLTCYLLPYIHYAIYNLLGKQYALPLALRTGGVGIVKCLLYAFLIIQITGWLEKRRIRLSI